MPRKNSISSLYHYEGNEPHTLVRVYQDVRHESLICTDCMASVCDHEPVTEDDMPIDELRWEATVRVRLPAGRWASGCDNEPVRVDGAIEYTAVIIEPE
jgi:hypothetical protein